jgi:hypothetical protein
LFLGHFVARWSVVFPSRNLVDGVVDHSLERFIAGGGGFFGIHAASSMAADIDVDWSWFRDLIGASFKGHTIAGGIDLAAGIAG